MAHWRVPPCGRTGVIAAREFNFGGALVPVRFLHASTASAARRLECEWNTQEIREEEDEEKMTMPRSKQNNKKKEEDKRERGQNGMLSHMMIILKLCYHCGPPLIPAAATGALASKFFARAQLLSSIFSFLFVLLLFLLCFLFMFSLFFPASCWFLVFRMASLRLFRLLLATPRQAPRKPEYMLLLIRIHAWPVMCLLASCLEKLQFQNVCVSFSFLLLLPLLLSFSLFFFFCFFFFVVGLFF